jgi:hypothetical protein
VPPRRRAVRMSTPGSRLRLPSARRCHAPGPVPPSRFLTTLTACSTRRLRVYCTPLPARGSSRFPSHATSLSEDSPGPRTRSPRCGFTPLEGSPSSAAVPRHRGRCPLVVSARSTPRYYASRTPPGFRRRSSLSRSIAPGGSRLARASRGIRTGVLLPLVYPARPDPPCLRLDCRDCRSSPAREPGANRSPPQLATSRRCWSGWRSTRRRECTRW